MTFPLYRLDYVTYSRVPLLRPLFGLSKSGLIRVMVLILNIEYSKCPKISNALFHTFLSKLFLLCICFSEYLVEWQTV